jgi:hypothetical protein
MCISVAGNSMISSTLGCLGSPPVQFTLSSRFSSKFSLSRLLRLRRFLCCILLTPSSLSLFSAALTLRWQILLPMDGFCAASCSHPRTYPRSLQRQQCVRRLSWLSTLLSPSPSSSPAPTMHQQILLFVLTLALLGQHA